MALVFDIETIGQDFDQLDLETQEYLARVAKDGEKPEDKTALFPMTGEIVSIGVFDSEKNKGVVYFQTDKDKEYKKDNIVYKPAGEKEMLKAFWQGAKNYDTFVGFYSRGFDVPFIIARSIHYNIKPNPKLMDGRYLYQQKYIKHIDLRDQLSYYGSVFPSGNLHMWCKLFGIKSSKEGDIKGSEVTRFFKEKKFKIIAEYNARDIIATNELYQKYLKFLT